MAKWRHGCAVIIAFAALTLVAAAQPNPKPPPWQIVKVERSKLGYTMQGNMLVPAIAPTERFLHVYVRNSNTFGAKLVDSKGKEIARQLNQDIKGPGAKILYFEGDFPAFDELYLEHGGFRAPLVKPKPGNKPKDKNPA